MKKTNAFFLSLFTAFSLHGQVLWTIPNVSFEQGDTVEAEFHVYNFNSIASFSYTMRCDTAFIDFLLVEQSPEFRDEQQEQGGIYTQSEIDSLLGKDPNFVEDGAKSSLATPLQFTGAMPNFGINNFSWHGRPGYNLLPGEIRTLHSQSSGTTVEDGLHIYTVRFRAKQAGSLSNKFWLWANHPILKPRAYKTPPLTSVGLSIAYVESLETTATTQPATTDLFNVFPNPATDTSTLCVELETPQSIMINVFDAQGYAVFGELAQHKGGKQCYTITFPVQSGTYYVRVQHGTTCVTKTIMKN